jgi:hypothetical protein
MPGKPSSKPSAQIPLPLLWAITVCLITLSAIAVIAVARLAGFDPQQVISLVKEAGSLIRSIRG